MLHEALDGAALPCRVAPFKEDDDALPGFFHPFLQFEQLYLQMIFLFLVIFAAHAVFVGVHAFAPTVHQFIVWAQCAVLATADAMTQKQAVYFFQVIGRETGKHGVKIAARFAHAPVGDVARNDVVQRFCLAVLGALHFGTDFMRFYLRRAGFADRLNVDDFFHVRRGLTRLAGGIFFNGCHGSLLTVDE